MWHWEAACRVQRRQSPPPQRAIRTLMARREQRVLLKEPEAQKSCGAEVMWEVSRSRRCQEVSGTGWNEIVMGEAVLGGSGPGGWG